MTLGRRLAAEGLGTALLLAIITGSGVMGEQLAQGNNAIALLANALATGAGLAVLILIFEPVSGGHFNPLVSIAEATRSRLQWHEVPYYVYVQIAGAFAGVAVAHMMFDKPLFFASQQARAGWPMMWSEVVATFGLIFVVLATTKTRPAATPFAVGAYITAAYWFTASTSFANPVVTMARAASDTFAGIRPYDAIGFIAAQAIGAAAASTLYFWLFTPPSRRTGT